MEELIPETSNSHSTPDDTLLQSNLNAQSEQLTGQLASQPQVEQFLSSVQFDNVTTDNLQKYPGMK